MRLAGVSAMLRRHDVFFAQDRRLALDQEARALVAVGDHAFAEDQALARLQFDFEAHCSPLLAAAYPAVSEGCRAGLDYWNSRSTFWSACAASDKRRGR